MIGELVMNIRKLVFRHVARNTILDRHRTGGTGMGGVGFGIRSQDVARQAALVICSRFAYERLVRIVAGGALYARIVPPACTVL